MYLLRVWMAQWKTIFSLWDFVTFSLAFWVSAICLCLISTNILTDTIGGFKFIFHIIVIQNIEVGGNIQSGYIYSYINL